MFFKQTLNIGILVNCKLEGVLLACTLIEHS